MFFVSCFEELFLVFLVLFLFFQVSLFYSFSVVSFLFSKA